MLRLFQDSSEKESHIIKMIKKYLLDSCHDGKSSSTMNTGDIDIISIIERAVFVGVESDKMINELPEEFEPKDWNPIKTGLDKFA